MQDEMTDLMDSRNEMQETLGRSYNISDDVDEEVLMMANNSAADSFQKKKSIVPVASAEEEGSEHICFLAARIALVIVQAS
ncbi:unnamed protein product [Urochloa humidicola]